MITPQREMTTEMLDLNTYSLSDLYALESQVLMDAATIVLRQVERPRANLGGSAPPGRAD
jgi:hypothetical protein